MCVRLVICVCVWPWKHDRDLSFFFKQKTAYEMRISDWSSDVCSSDLAVTDDPNDTTAKFFIRVSSKQDISDITGTGTVNPQTSAIVNWLLIPAPGSSSAERRVGKECVSTCRSRSSP